MNIPVIAAGGIMDGADIAAVLKLGAAAQLGTAFIACPESLPALSFGPKVGRCRQNNDDQGNIGTTGPLPS